jgi:hypothetical protein
MHAVGSIEHSDNLLLPPLPPEKQIENKKKTLALVALLRFLTRACTV